MVVNIFQITFYYGPSVSSSIVKSLVKRLDYTNPLRFFIHFYDVSGLASTFKHSDKQINIYTAKIKNCAIILRT